MLIHAGFHKTGTTSVQKMLAHNRRLLSQETRVFLRKDMVAVCEAARSYSASRDRADLVAFTYELASFFEGLRQAPRKSICISSEDLTGHMPGRRGLKTYDAAPILMKAFVMTVEKLMPTPPEMVFYFSTRSAEGWLRSCHTQHLKAVRMTLSEEEYAKQYAASANLENIIAKIRIAVGPHRVEQTALEISKNTALGPLTPILNLLDISPDLRRKIETLPPANMSIAPELKAEYLRLNRSDLDYGSVRKAKVQARNEWNLSHTSPEP